MSDAKLRDFARQGGRPVTAAVGTFLHGFNLGDWFPCWNLWNSGVLRSPDALARGDPTGFGADHQPISATPIEQLVSGNVRSSVTPRLVFTVMAGAALRRGEELSFADWTTAALTPDCRRYYIDRSEIELVFEVARREASPSAPSRLSSLYLVEDSENGAEHIRSMLGDVHVIRVVLHEIGSFVPVDTTWYDKYVTDRKPEYLLRYWRGEPFDPAAPRWEYLLDGAIRVLEKEELQRTIEAEGTLPPSASGWPQRPRGASP